MGSEKDTDGEMHPFNAFSHSIYNFFETPVVWFRKNVVEPNRKEYYWYHQKYRRVPTVDQCYDDDPVCKFEADQQFQRDFLVDSAILTILRRRYEHCILYESPDMEKCKPMIETYDQASADWFAKYGDLGGFRKSSEKAYFKQKHRMIWERRHGKIGTGMEGNRPEKIEETEQ